MCSLSVLSALCLSSAWSPWFSAGGSCPGGVCSGGLGSPVFCSGPRRYLPRVSWATALPLPMPPMGTSGHWVVSVVLLGPHFWWPWCSLGALGLLCRVVCLCLCAVSSLCLSFIWFLGGLVPQAPVVGAADHVPRAWCGAAVCEHGHRGPCLASPSLSS